jgi:hypothetical protein
MSSGGSLNFKDTEQEAGWVSEETMEVFESTKSTPEAPTHETNEEIVKRLRDELMVTEQTLQDSEQAFTIRQAEKEDRIKFLEQMLMNAPSSDNLYRVISADLEKKISGLRDTITSERESYQSSYLKETIFSLEERLKEAEEPKLQTLAVETTHKHRMDVINTWAKYGMEFVRLGAQLGAGYVLLNTGLPMLSNPELSTQGYSLISAGAVALIPGSASMLTSMLDFASTALRKKPEEKD